jgi:hypothetical protein
MRTRPATTAEVDTWLAVLCSHGYLHRAEATPDACWIVQHRPHDRPWTLHHPVLAMDWIEDVLRRIRRHDAGPGQ